MPRAGNRDAEPGERQARRRQEDQPDQARIPERGSDQGPPTPECEVGREGEDEQRRRLEQHVERDDEGVRPPEKANPKLSNMVILLGSCPRPRADADPGPAPASRPRGRAAQLVQLLGGDPLILDQPEDQILGRPAEELRQQASQGVPLDLLPADRRPVQVGLAACLVRDVPLRLEDSQQRPDRGVVRLVLQPLAESAPPWPRPGARSRP